ncbi:hypothetical protein AAG570_002119 [Ranatra chinensis]|uniref:Uncharacterized protein n=1 Tax=Ranatra chinensis TaxID=642074 RepID=A0ABD0Y6K0_9HEMI
MFYQNKKKETTEIGMSLNLPNSESELRNEADLIESRLTSTSFFHMYNEAPPNKIRCLPLLFTKGMPTALDDFSLEELKCFLPYLIGVSAKFEGRNVWSTPPCLSLSLGIIDTQPNFTPSQDFLPMYNHHPSLPTPTSSLSPRPHAQAPLKLLSHPKYPVNETPTLDKQKSKGKISSR